MSKINTNKEQPDLLVDFCQGQRVALHLLFKY